MSAYQVNKETLGRIAHALKHAATVREFSSRCDAAWILGGIVTRKLAAIGFILHDDATEATPRDFADFCEELATMNARAVMQRYPHDEPVIPLAAPFPSPPDIHNLWQLHKSLECYLYQCAEGDVPETWALYKALDETKDALATVIVQADPRWESAAWGDNEGFRAKATA